MLDIRSGVGHDSLAMTELFDQMTAVCERHDAPFVSTPLDAIAGVARNTGSGLLPLNGLRHRRGTTSGWFIWAGDELSEDGDFFVPTHLHHLVDRCPEALPMLGLGARPQTSTYANRDRSVAQPVDVVGLGGGSSGTMTVWAAIVLPVSVPMICTDSPTWMASPVIPVPATSTTLGDDIVIV